MNPLVLKLVKLGVGVFLTTYGSVTVYDIAYQKTIEAEWEAQYRANIREVILQHPELIKIEEVRVLTEEERQEWLENGIEDKGFNNNGFTFEYGKPGKPKNKFTYTETKESKFLRPEEQEKIHKKYNSDK